jgi:hypothetical protein
MVHNSHARARRSLWLHGELHNAPGSFIVQLVAVRTPGMQANHARVSCDGHTADAWHATRAHAWHAPNTRRTRVVEYTPYARGGGTQEKFLTAADEDVGNANLIRGLNLTHDAIFFDNARIEPTKVRRRRSLPTESRYRVRRTALRRIAKLV